MSESVTADFRSRFVTIGDRMRAVGDRSSGFDYMRLILAAGVIVLHGSIVCHGQLVEIEVWQSPARPIFRMILPMFFALSGFLVAGSLMRSRTLVMFLGLRIIRIFPALSVEVALSALILGPMFTSRALSTYFHSDEFSAYWWNIIGHVHYLLPGVFETNPNPGVVNGQLWTVPYELYCYLTITCLTLAGAIGRRWILSAAAAAITFAYLAYREAAHGMIEASIIGPLPGAMLVVCFLLGAAIHFYRDEIPFGMVAGAIAFGASALLLSWMPYGDYLAAWPVAYATVCLGLLDPMRTPIVKGADYSYGLFLYGYPIQQALAATSDALRYWPVNVVATMIVGSLVAILSWRFVERPALGMRSRLRALEELWLKRAAAPENSPRQGAATDAAPLS
jgi:peptidoglycan/LPS O-acetylase OafA/YrhL